MRTFIGLALGFAVAACAAPGAERGGAAPAAFETASFRSLYWGATVHYWTVDAGGAVMWEAPEKGPFPAAEGKSDARPGIRIGIKRFQLDAERRAALAAAVARADKARALPDTCKTYVPDGPYGRLAWTRDGAEMVAMVNASCLKGPQADKAAAAFGADRIVRDVADTQPVVEHRVE